MISVFCSLGENTFLSLFKIVAVCSSRISETCWMKPVTILETKHSPVSAKRRIINADAYTALGKKNMCNIKDDRVT